MQRRVTCWPPLSPVTWLRPAADALPFPAEEEGARLYAFARQGLHHGVIALGLGPGDAVLVPAYHHGSEVEALHAAGLTCVFYGGGDGVHPDEAELDRLLTPDVRALHLTHALGLPQDSLRWRRWCDRHGLLLIEDAAQAWLAWHADVPVGSHADLAVFCAYKSAPVPEGAFVHAPRTHLPVPSDNQALGLQDLVRRHGGWLAQRSPLAGAAVLALHLERPVDPAADLAVRSEHTGAWTTTRGLLERLDLQPVAAVRRAHYRLLLDETGGQVPEPFAVLPDGASPFAFPLLVEDKARAMQRLRDAGIWPLDLWSRSHPLLSDDAFPAVAHLRRSVLGLPVHQGLRRRDIARIAAVAAPARRRPQVEVDVLSDLTAAEPVWRALADSTPNPFATFEWAQAWRRHHENRGEPLLGVCRTSSGRDVALLALQRQDVAGVRTLRFWGAEAADVSGPVCAPGDEILAAQGLRALLAATSDWQVLLGERLPATTAWPNLLDAARVRREASPVLLLGSQGWVGWLATRSRNFRQQVRRHERNLLLRGATFRLSSQDTLARDLESLFALHALRWPEGTHFSRHRRFHEDFAGAAAARGWLRLWLLEVDGRPVAAWYGLRYAGHDWYYQAGRDPDWDSLHAGGVLLAHTVRDAADAGMTSYRFLRGDEAYKARYTTYDPGTEGFVLGRRGTGALAARAIRAAAALPEPPRARLRTAFGT